jgi:hypothetical protein
VTIQLPPLNSSSTGPPQKLVRQATQGPLPRDCSIRSSKGGRHEAGHVDQLVNGYRPQLTPGNLVRILAKGQSSTDLIHTKSTQVFWSFGHLLARNPPERAGRSSARPLPRSERTAARSARGRRPFKHETVHITTRVVSTFGGNEGAAGRWLLAGVPSHRGPARQPGDRNHPDLFGRLSNSEEICIHPRARRPVRANNAEGGGYPDRQPPLPMRGRRPDTGARQREKGRHLRVRRTGHRGRTGRVNALVKSCGLRTQ